jgi:hypothetical protein
MKKIGALPSRIGVLSAFLLLAPAWVFAQQSPTPVSTHAPNPALTNADVQKMVEAKLADPIIVAKIRASTCNFGSCPRFS